MKEELRRIIEAKTEILSWIKKIPTLAVVLGSGLGRLADSLTDSVEIPFSKIPHFPCSTVQGHEGSLVFGRLNETEVIMMKGRVHYYEGFSMEEVVRPIRILIALGIESLLLTNAAGGISSNLSPGTLMTITDHLSLFGENPLRGENFEEFGPRFPDMSKIYAPEFQTLLEKLATELNIPLKKGVYAYTSGPSYETPAEIRLLAQLGVHAVGMSTVPEAIVANHGGIKVAGISCITNMAAGIEDKQLNHNEVLTQANAVKEDFSRLVCAFIERYHEK